MNLNPAWGIEETLRQVETEKARVTVHLAGGVSFTGFVQGVDGGYVVVSHLAQKEFYDALIALDQIAALELQTRRG